MDPEPRRLTELRLALQQLQFLSLTAERLLEALLEDLLRPKKPEPKRVH